MDTVDFQDVAPGLLEDINAESHSSLEDKGTAYPPKSHIAAICRNKALGFLGMLFQASRLKKSHKEKEKKPNSCSHQQLMSYGIQR